MQQESQVGPSQQPSPIVSSAHLVSPQSAEMSEFEFGLIVAGNAFHRWIVHCMSAAGLKDLTPLDVMVLHHVTHRARDTRLADICFIMNVEDTHLINYSLKKLQGLGVLASQKNGSKKRDTHKQIALPSYFYPGLQIGRPFFFFLVLSAIRSEHISLCCLCASK
jgi:predicted MarR family transcription regulator